MGFFHLFFHGDRDGERQLPSSSGSGCPFPRLPPSASTFSMPSSFLRAWRRLPLLPGDWPVRPPLRPFHTSETSTAWAGQGMASWRRPRPSVRLPIWLWHEWTACGVSRRPGTGKAERRRSAMLLLSMLAGEKASSCKSRSDEIAPDFTSPRAASAFYSRAQRRMLPYMFVGAGNFRGGDPDHYLSWECCKAQTSASQP